MFQPTLLYDSEKTRQCSCSAAIRLGTNWTGTTILARTGARDTYVLRVRGDSMIDEQIRDGDFVVVEDRKSADNGEMVIALVRGSDVTLKKFYRDPGGKIRLQPANVTMQPIFVDPDQVQIQGVVVGVMRKY